MTPALFAVVDAVLARRMEDTMLDQDWPQDVWGASAWQCALDLGWWRSMW